MPEMDVREGEEVSGGGAGSVEVEEDGLSGIF